MFSNLSTSKKLWPLDRKKPNVNEEELDSSSITSSKGSSDDWDSLLKHHKLTPEEEEIANYETKAPRSKKQKLLRVIWDSADKPAKERRFLFKLDLFFLSSVCAGYFIKTLNLNNLTYSYNNGMKEDLHLVGNQLNYLQTMWTVGYIVGQIPSQFILHHVSARFYLGGLELLWTILTVLTVTVHNYSNMCAVRFFVGLTEAGFFPGVEYLMGSWYSSEEITKRSTIFAQAGVAASMITGFLQAAIVDGMQNEGLPAYKWIFVIDAVISFPVAIYTMIANPNTPETTTSWYFNEQDKRVALIRRKRTGAKPKKHFSLAAFKRLGTTWHVYIFPLIFLAYNNACAVNSQPTFQGWLKSEHYSSNDYNMYPSAVNGTGIGLSLILGWTADWFGGLNWPFLALFFICEIIGCALLAKWNIGTGAKFFSYFLTGAPTAWGQPMVFSWLNRLLVDDNELRNLNVVLTNNLAYVTTAFVPIFTWSAKDMPRYFIGFTFTACLCAFGLVLTFIALYLARRDAKRHQARLVGHVEVDNTSGSVSEDFKGHSAEVHSVEESSIELP